MGIAAAIAGVVGDIALSAGISSAAAGVIGTVGAGALIGGASGAGIAALTHGNVLTGALTGAIGGGAIGGLGGASGALTGALGGGTAGTVGADALLGAGAGAIGSGVTGQNPLTGALTGAVGGGLTGAIQSYGGIGAGSASSPVSGTGGDLGAPASGISSGDMAGLVASAQQLGSNAGAPGVGAAAGNAVDNADVTSSLTGSGSPSTTVNPQSTVAAAGAGGGGGGGGTGASSGSGLYGSSGGTGTSGALDKLMSNPAVLLGALATVGSIFNKPQASTQAMPGPTSVAQPALFTTPLSPPGTFTGAQPVNPGISNYYTYGQIPGGAQYFTNNSAAAYGLARGGALSRHVNDNEYVPNDNNRHVRGPGGPTGDKIPAMLSDGEYVLDNRDLQLIGHGSNERGARILDRQRRKLNRSGSGALAQLAGSR
jgi:hypothetical protein